MSICKPTFVPKWRILNITELVLMIDNPAKNPEGYCSKHKPLILTLLYMQNRVSFMFSGSR